jgi:hypothetical protein
MVGRGMEPPEPQKLVLDDELRQLVADSWQTSPMVVACVSPTGRIVLSYRGSVQPFGPTALAFWARNPEGDTVTGLQDNPNVTLHYRDPGTASLTFYGRGHVTRDEKERNEIFDAQNERERDADPERKGVAIIVDLDEITGRTPNGPILLRREI